jgi:hypothetical protein
MKATAKVSLVAVFTALSLATNYAMIDVPNVKLMDSLVFLSAFLFGWDVGVASATSIWLIYGFVNPNGADTFFLLSFLIVGECIYAVAGGLMRRTFTRRDILLSGDYRYSAVVFGGMGLLTTFAYDVLTNFGDKLQYITSPYQALVIGLVTGVPFAILHEVSNVVFFGTIVPAAIYATRRLGGRTI